MKIKTYLLILIVYSACMNAQKWETPIIDGFGEVKYFDKANIQPNPSLKYKLLFDIKDQTEKNGVNKGLWVIARTLNMLSLGKVPIDNIKIVASIHGDASFLALNDKVYKNKFGKINSNLELIDKLIANGVEIYVCSQATASRNINQNSINKKIKRAYSGLSVLANYQLRDYIFMPY
ncbi:MAG: hypothetical protein CBD39_01525 [Flavobacteriaceae bacterium TMED179]|nr:MAG: hypothetical protein CBD39_01525 [Flavobacteriaceae bacterium TMED179]|tara:strand:+ start:13422 stop:13952 length:531 start_codon:yes stop_codon:yes gene_type:complete